MVNTVFDALEHQLDYIIMNDYIILYMIINDSVCFLMCDSFGLVAF